MGEMKLTMPVARTRFFIYPCKMELTSPGRASL